MRTCYQETTVQRTVPSVGLAVGCMCGITYPTGGQRRWWPGVDVSEGTPLPPAAYSWIATRTPRANSTPTSCSAHCSTRSYKDSFVSEEEHKQVWGFQQEEKR
jgi:hypothetical protein